MKRTSRKEVEVYIARLNNRDSQELGYKYRLICHQWLGNRANYHYTYSLMKDHINDGLEGSTEILWNVSLKKIAERLRRYLGY